MINPLRRIPSLYHFTDRRNLPLIREMGGLYPLAELEAAGVVIPAPGSDEGSRLVDRGRNLHRYVHLCFKGNHPMEHVARLFVPGMANTNNIDFYTMEQARKMIDYEVLYTRTVWSDPRYSNACKLPRRMKFWFQRRSPWS